MRYQRKFHFSINGHSYTYIFYGRIIIRQNNFILIIPAKKTADRLPKKYSAIKIGYCVIEFKKKYKSLISTIYVLSVGRSSVGISITSHQVISACF